MQGRTRALWALWCIVLLGLVPGASAQQAQPKIWTPIDVWGVSGHSVGEIRLAQRTVNGFLRFSLIGEFKPANGKTLDELAAILWPGAKAGCLHFNWIQVTVDPGNPPLPVDASGLPRNPPFVDPPPGGYQGDSKPADALPWFLDESLYVPKQSADLNIHNPDITLPFGLRWYMKPYSATTPDTMRYDTVLVLINDCTSQYQPLGGFHWQANFPKQGDPFFEIAPFLATEPFPYGELVSSFGQGTHSNPKRRVFKIRPLVKL